MFRFALQFIALFLFVGVAFSTPPALPAPGKVFKQDVAEIRHVLYGGFWYEIVFDFKSRYYTCPNLNDEHVSWTGEVESWDDKGSTLVFKEARVECKPDDLPKAGPVSLVRMRFYRCPTTHFIKASVAGGSWHVTEVEFR